MKTTDNKQEIIRTSSGQPRPWIWKNSIRQALSYRPISLERLGNTLDIAESDLAAAIEQADKAKNASAVGWSQRSKALLDTARQAFDNADAERGWRCLKAADRFLLYSLKPKRLRIEAGPILAEATEEGMELSKWRKTSVKGLLCDSDGKLKKRLNPRDVVRAKRILDEYHDNVYQKMEILRRRLRFLAVASWIALAVWLISPPFSPYPISLTAGTTGSDASNWLWLRLMWVGIVLSGILGALFSGFSSSISADRKKARIPSELSTSTVTFARLSMAVVAALAVSIFLASGVLKISNPSYELMLAVAFVSGFSDRLLLRSIESLSK